MRNKRVAVLKREINQWSDYIQQRWVINSYKDVMLSATVLWDLKGSFCINILYMYKEFLYKKRRRISQLKFQSVCCHKWMRERCNFLTKDPHWFSKEILHWRGSSVTTAWGRQKSRYSGNGGGDQGSIRAMCGILLHNTSLLLQRSPCSIQRPLTSLSPYVAVSASLS